ncbi:hypothetical protein FHS43_001413 [Streptosporangium becharense]|uniref:Uncharacterized protein n=1 Tax=Streptosporangium becharense TaxID=1816182 RepID=A0A7W9IMK4_9ACTN|nr:DUF6716 putative glycosyltransferase [Streptosporangium becharense]MBB2910150.1 hypothetical protein [Streptosporangium becharense]MBB5822893.1 hypothetical protein [Streptosporangium becharense]
MADSDSYLKWAACLLRDLPSGCDTELAVIRTPIVPSEAQIHAAVAGSAADPPVLSARGLRRVAERFRPDAVLVACTGPVVDVLVGEVLSGLRPRPVFVSGLPGISVPATEKAWLFRSGCELFVLHSGREVEEFSAAGRRLGGGGEVGLARLPFLHTRDEVPVTGPRNRVVFATQAKVPRRREERERILLTLAELAGERPDLDVVVKLRALDTERQTHNERYHYQRLWQRLAADGRVDPGAVRFAVGPMHEHLAHAAGFVTVSSTAALEAIAQRVPLLVLSDFGVGAEMINLVFEGSGLLGTLDDLARGRFLTPDEAWCKANYFHPDDESDWISRLVSLVGQARSGRLVPARSLLDGPEFAAARRRARLRVEVPPKVLRVGYRAKRRMRRYLKVLG